MVCTRLGRACDHVTDYYARNKSLTAKLLQQDYRYTRTSKSNIHVKITNLVNKFKELIDMDYFSLRVRKIISRYGRI